jgi:hypothetical protein
MGWQVHSFGGKYGSPMGHGLLVGALTKKVLKKVLDSVLYNKKCGTCTKHLPWYLQKCEKACMHQKLQGDIKSNGS